MAACTRRKRKTIKRKEDALEFMEHLIKIHSYSRHFIIINMNWCSFLLCFASAFATKFNHFPRQNFKEENLWKFFDKNSPSILPAYFYIYDNNLNLHNLNSQMLSSTKHLFLQGSIRGCTTHYTMYWQFNKVLYVSVQ